MAQLQRYNVQINYAAQINKPGKIQTHPADTYLSQRLRNTHTPKRRLAPRNSPATISSTRLLYRSHRWTRLLLFRRVLRNVDFFDTRGLKDLSVAQHRDRTEEHKCPDDESHGAVYRAPYSNRRDVQLAV